MVISPLYVIFVTVIKHWLQRPMVIDFKSKYLYTTAHIGKMLTMSFPQEKVMSQMSLVDHMDVILL